MKIGTYIFIHNQDILLDLINKKTLDNLGDFIFVFLGGGECEKIKHLNNVLIAREFEYNIEEYSKLTSFTGWYLLWKNNLIKSEYVNLFEYDVKVVDFFNDVVNDRIKNNEIIGYLPINVHHDLFIKNDGFSKELVEAIDSVYGINTREIINSLPPDKTCSVTSNHTFSIGVFDRYMNWVEKLLPHIKGLELAGHQIERSISLFYLLNKIENVCLVKNILTHYQLDSHKTQGFSEEVISKKYNDLIS